MGKINSSEPQQKETTHFSHPHPLKLINYHPSLNLLSPCSGCKLNPSGLIYSCTPCNYFLHKKCFEMPKTISHPFHKEHAFTLLPTPAYAEGLYNCDACGHAGDGFSYHCKPCGIDLHILCAATPLSLPTLHHPHKLHLTFGSPYDSKNFVCDVCKAQGSDHWLYRCDTCGFDAHLRCASRTPPPQQVMAGSRSSPMPQPQGLGVPYFTAAAPPPPKQQYFAAQPPPTQQYFAAPPPPMQQYFTAAAPPPMQQGIAPHNVMNFNPAVGFPAGGAMAPAAFGVNRGQNEVFLQALKQIIENQKAMTQAVMAGGGGLGGGYGGNNGVQQLMQLMSSVNGTGGFGGGGAIPGGLNAFGGGGGQDFLQSLMSGGGGLDSLQSLLGTGGSGGLEFLSGGGLDLLGGLGGLF